LLKNDENMREERAERVKNFGIKSARRCNQAQGQENYFRT